MSLNESKNVSKRTWACLAKDMKSKKTSTVRGYSFVKGEVSLISRSVSPVALGIILAVGLSIGLALLFANHITIPLMVFNLTPPYLLAGSVLFGTCSLVSLVYFTINGASTYWRKRKFEKTHPEIHNPSPSSPKLGKQAKQPIQREAVSPGQWANRLKGSPKDINGTLYYDLTGANKKPKKLKLGMKRDFLQIPHLDYYSKEEFSPDVAMAVRLPDSQLAAFPKGIRKAFEKEENLELYFLVFRNHNEQKDKFHNISLHAMALGNYKPKKPTETDKEGQFPYRDEYGNEGLTTDMEIAMCDTQGIDGSFNGEGAFRNKFTNFSLSIHTTEQGHAFSGNVACFKVKDKDQVDVKGEDEVASMFVAARFLDRAVAFHALIINDPNSEEGQKLSEAKDAANLQIFMDDLDKSKFIYAEKVRRTLRGADSNPALDDELSDELALD